MGRRDCLGQTAMINMSGMILCLEKRCSGCISLETGQSVVSDTSVVKSDMFVGLVLWTFNSVLFYRFLHLVTSSNKTSFLTQEQCQEKRLDHQRAWLPNLLQVLEFTTFSSVKAFQFRDYRVIHSYLSSLAARPLVQLSSLGYPRRSSRSSHS